VSFDRLAAQSRRPRSIAIVLIAITGAVMLGLSGGAGASELLGPLPEGALAQSRCAGFRLSRHVGQRGQTVVATVTPKPEWCKKETTSWTFPLLSGTRSVRGCNENATSCTYKVTGPSFPTSGIHYETVCINGQSGQGPWDSCDYWAAQPNCVGTPTFKVQHKRVGRETIVTFAGKKWDTKDCGPVMLTISGERGAVQKAVYERSSFSGTIRVNGRLCGIQLRAAQLTGRALTGGFDNGGHAEAIVMIAKPGTMPNGEQLIPGDFLCRSEIDFDPAHMTVANVRALASKLGQQLLEVNTRQAAAMVDAAGKVSVEGVSLESADSQLLATERDLVSHQNNAASLPEKPEGQSLGLSGFNKREGSLTVEGNLNLDGAVLYVEGELHVTGAITGRGAVFVTGNITAEGGSTLQTDAIYGLVAGGSLGLP
jgi:hypothetical protein